MTENNKIMELSPTFHNCCRFCAEEKYSGDIHILSSDTTMFIEVEEMVYKLNLECIDFSAPLPKTCCRDCLDKLKNSHHFIMKVRESQQFLKNIFFPTHEPLITNRSIKQEPKPINYDLYIKKELSDNISTEDICNSQPLKDPELPSTSSGYYEIPLINHTDFNLKHVTDKSTANFNKKFKEEFVKRTASHIDELNKNSSLQKLNLETSCSDTEKLDRSAYLRQSKNCYCHICDRHFKDRKTCYYHMKNHLKSKKLNTPLRTMKPKGAPLTEEDVTCDNCGKLFQTKAYLAVHKQVYCPNAPRSKDVVCDICGKAFYSKIHLYEHRMRHMAQIAETPLHQCQVCQKTFPTFRQLKNHVSVHTGEKPYTCDDCGQKFRLQSQLHNHMKNKHISDEKPYECEICQKKFRLKKTYNTHQLQHSGIKPYSCEHCEKSFVDWSNYMKHALRKHNIDIRKNKPTRTDDQVFQEWLQSIQNKLNIKKGRKKVTNDQSLETDTPIDGQNAQM